MILWLLASATAVTLALVSFVAIQDRSMRSAPLAEPLEMLAVPDQLVLIDVDAIDGQWLFFGPRQPSASRTYVVAGNALETCSSLERFYRIAGIPIEPPTVSPPRPDTLDSCRRILVGQDIDVFVSIYPEWRDLPPSAPVGDAHSEVRIAAY